MAVLRPERHRPGQAEDPAGPFAADLSVEHLVEGRVRPDGPTARSTARVMRARPRDSPSGALCTIARRNSPRAPSLIIRCALVASPPADCPNTVTASGSPPKAAMFSCTQRRAAIRVEQPEVRGDGLAVSEEPEDAER